MHKSLSLITVSFVLLVSLVTAQTTPVPGRSQADSVRIAKAAEKKRTQDSIRQIQDSLQLLWIKFPDPARPNAFLDSLRSVLLIENGDALSWALHVKKDQDMHHSGLVKFTRERWILIAIACLLLFFAVLKRAFSNEVYAIAEAFFSNRTLGQINKEDNLFTSWAFVFLYILFGFTIGMFMFLAGTYYAGNTGYRFDDYLTYTFLVLVLFTLKIIITRLIGFIFGIQRIVREYVSILYLSYFNAALLFLPLVLILSLVPQKQMYMYLGIALILFAVMLIFQLLRAANSIFNTYRFSKFYLFIYLCTLEIGPVLVLIKVLDV